MKKGILKIKNWMLVLLTGLMGLQGCCGTKEPKCMYGPPEKMYGPPEGTFSMKDTPRQATGSGESQSPYVEIENEK